MPCVFCDLRVVYPILVDSLYINMNNDLQLPTMVYWKYPEFEKLEILGKYHLSENFQ